jgi:hypothetical protein
MADSRAGLRQDYGVASPLLPSEINRVNGIVAFQTQRGFAETHGYGLLSGWQLRSDSLVGVGTGIFPSGWYAATLSNQAIVGLVNGYTNYVYGTSIDATAPTMALLFTANISGVRASTDLFLGTLTLDADGNVTAINGIDPALPYVVHPAANVVYPVSLSQVAGSGTETNILSQEVRAVHISHAAFKLPGAINIAVSAEFTYAVTAAENGAGFILLLSRSVSYSPSSCSYSWSRWGIA